MSTSGSEFRQNLIRLLYATPAVTAAYLGGDLAQPAPASLEWIDLYLVVPPGFREGMSAWLTAAGESAFSGPVREGWRLVSLDGVEWRFHLHPPSQPEGLQPLFDRCQDPTGAPVAAAIDLAEMAGRFWSDLYRAAHGLRRGWPLTVHGDLEECRRALVDLYRLALAPRAPRQGWEGADGIAGDNQALESVREWLVAPLDLRAQWRCAHRLAATYESLMLPLCQRLGVPYPMAMRNLAFQQLDRVRPDRGKEAPGPVTTETAPPADHSPESHGRLRLVKGRIRRPT